MTRSFVFSPQDEEEHGWPTDEGKPESWEERWHTPRSADEGSSVTDVGASLGLPGLERSYFDGYSFDLEIDISGRKWERPQSSP